MKKKIFGLLITIFTFGMVLNVNAITISTDNSNHATSDSNSLLVTNTGTITISNVKTGDEKQPFWWMLIAGMSWISAFAAVGFARKRRMNVPAGIRREKSEL